jgi:hypothetical protein
MLLVTIAARLGAMAAWLTLLASTGLVGLVDAYGTPGETPHIRKYLYAGGHYDSDGAGAHIFRDQMYVEHLIPLDRKVKPYPIVFIHGQAQTGTVCTPILLELRLHGGFLFSFRLASVFLC